MFEEELQSNKLCILGKLTAGIFHEIRNPLSVVKLNLDYLTLLNEKIPLDGRESIQSAYEALERIQNLINSIIIFSRKENKGDDYCSIYELTIKAMEILSSTAIKDNITIINNVSPDIPKINFERNKFLQVILNLLTNSMEACRSIGFIEISSEINSQKDIILQIKDNGCGISEENKPRVFQDFYTSKKEGTGIGLSVCKGILKEYGCKINFESILGHGTIFYIIIANNLIREHGKEITDC